MGKMIKAVQFIQDYECTVDSSSHQIVVHSSDVDGSGLTLADAVDDLVERLRDQNKQPEPRTQIVIPEDDGKEIVEALGEAKDALAYAASKLSLFGDDDSSSRIYEASDNVRDVYLAWGGK